MPLTRRTGRLLSELMLRRYRDSLKIEEWSLRRAEYVDEGDYRYYGPEGETASPGVLRARCGRPCSLRQPHRCLLHGRQERPALCSRPGARGCCL